MNHWTDDMYRYLSLLTFKDVLEVAEWNDKEDEKVDELLDGLRRKLDRDERLIVENRASRIQYDYESELYREFQEENCYKYGDDDLRPTIRYEEEHYNVWSQAVRQKKVVWMEYDSTNSGMTDA